LHCGLLAKAGKNGTKGHYHCSECGKNFDIDHNEIADLKIPAKSKKGCGGDLASGNIMISLITLIAAFMVLKKKRKQAR